MMKYVPCIPCEARIGAAVVYAFAKPSSNPSETIVFGVAAPAGAVYASAKTDASSTAVAAATGRSRRNLDFLDCFSGSAIDSTR